MNKKTKVVILYRVLSHYRVPILEKLNDFPDIELTIVHGCDFPGTKVVNSKAVHRFTSVELRSLPIRLKTSNGLAVAPFSPGLLAALLKLKPDVIVCEGASNLPNNILTYIYAKLFGAKLVQWGLGEIKGWKKSRLRRMLDWLIEAMERSTDACIAYSSRGYAYYEKIGVPSDHIFIAVNVVDTDRVVQLSSQLDMKQIHRDAHRDINFVVLFVGALNKEKQVDMLIKAFQTFCRATRANAKLFIVGDGDDRKRLETIATADPSARIEFAGHVVDGVGRYFAMADIFVLPGLGGLAVSEAMAYGVPVIAGIGDGCEVDLLEDGGGILDETLSETSLTDHLTALYKNPDLITSMKAAAKKTISQKYNVTTYVDGIMKAIKKSQTFDV